MKFRVNIFSRSLYYGSTEKVIKCNFILVVMESLGSRADGAPLVLFAARLRPRGFYQDGFFQGLLVAILMILNACIYVIKVQFSSALKPLMKKLKLIHQICNRFTLKKPVLIKPPGSLSGRKEQILLQGGFFKNMSQKSELI